MEINSDIEQNNLKLAIFKCLAWFDLFAHPLSPYEIWQYLDIKTDFASIFGYLAQNPVNEFWQSKNGLFFLPGREEIIYTRLTRYNETDKKIKIALKISRLFKLAPSVKFIAVANIIGSHNLRAESDIDLFIVTAPGRIWLSRLYCAGLAKILNLRPNARTKQNKICLSFYLSADNLKLAPLKLEGEDPYFNYWLAGLVPIYNRAEIYLKLIRDNSWLRNFFPNFISAGLNPRRELGGRKSRPGEGRLEVSERRKILRPIFNYLEKVSRAGQLRILPASLRKLMNRDSRVIIKDNILKLYLVDRRAELRDKYLAKIKNLAKL